MSMAAISLLIGIILSQKFDVLALVPPMVLALIFAIGTAAFGIDPWWDSCATSVIIILGLQFGYLIFSSPGLLPEGLHSAAAISEVY